MLGGKWKGIKFHFLNLWYDSTWDWTLVTWNIGEHSSYSANGPVNSKYIKLVNLFTYFDSNISLIENDVWDVTERSLIIWKSDLSDIIKHDFLQAVAMCLLYGPYKRHWKRTRWKPRKNHTSCLWQILEPTPKKQQLYSHLSPISKTIQDTLVLLEKDEIISDDLL